MLQRLLLWRRWTGRKSPSSGMKSPNKQLLVWFSSFSRSELWLRLCLLPIIPGVQETLIMLCHTHSWGNWCLSSICLLFVYIFKLIHAFRMFLLCCFMQYRDLNMHFSLQNEAKLCVVERWRIYVNGIQSHNLINLLNRFAYFDSSSEEAGLFYIYVRWFPQIFGLFDIVVKCRVEIDALFVREGGWDTR